MTVNADSMPLANDVRGTNRTSVRGRGRPRRRGHNLQRGKEMTFF